MKMAELGLYELNLLIQIPFTRWQQNMYIHDISIICVYIYTHIKMINRFSVASICT